MRIWYHTARISHRDHITLRTYSTESISHRGHNETVIDDQIIIDHIMGKFVLCDAIYAKIQLANKKSDLNCKRHRVNVLPSKNLINVLCVWLDKSDFGLGGKQFQMWNPKSLYDIFYAKFTFCIFLCQPGSFWHFCGPPNSRWLIKWHPKDKNLVAR